MCLVYVWSEIASTHMFAGIVRHDALIERKRSRSTIAILGVPTTTPITLRWFQDAD